MSKSSLLIVGSIYKEECCKYMKSLVQFAKECCGLDDSKSFNRVDLKKSILNSTRGRSLTKFVQTLSKDDKKNLLKVTSMECPVICPNKKVILKPIESMPSNIMKSSKKLRNFFGIPELQVCRGCIKKGRCRRYQEIERDVPDLSDLASVMIGMYSICKIHLDGNELVVPEFAFKELDPLSSVLSCLNKYFKDFKLETHIPRGDDKACLRELRRVRRQNELKKLDLLKEKILNIPSGYNIMPRETTYMASFQRELFNKLNKKKPPEEEYVWVSDVADTTLPDEDPKLEKINQVQIKVDGDNSEPFSKTDFRVNKIEDLKTSDIHFRMEYFKPLGTEVNLQRYDVINDRSVEGIKINSKGRFEVDLDSNLRNKLPNDNEYIKDGISMYKLPSTNKLSSLSKFISNLDSCPNDLSFLRRVPYNYKCQSSGEDLKSKENDMENLKNIAEALNSRG